MSAAIGEVVELSFVFWGDEFEAFVRHARLSLRGWLIDVSQRFLKSGFGLCSRFLDVVGQSTFAMLWLFRKLIAKSLWRLKDTVFV